MEVSKATNSTPNLCIGNTSFNETFDTPFRQEYTRIFFIIIYVAVCVTCVTGKYIHYFYSILDVCNFESDIKKKLPNI